MRSQPSTDEAAIGLDRVFQDVADFHKCFRLPTSPIATELPVDRIALRHLWMLEELAEFRTAIDMVEQADALMDLIYLALGTMVEMGVRPGAVFAFVHAANMAKIWPDGQPKLTSDGKAVKPPRWIPPNDAIRRHLKPQ